MAVVRHHAAAGRAFRVVAGLSRMAHISIENLTVEFAIFGARARSLKNTILSQATGGRVMAGARDIVKRITPRNPNTMHSDLRFPPPQPFDSTSYGSGIICG
jgi:hypothetical protein